MNVLFLTNLPSPYRVDFFNELGKLCNLTVAYERRSANDRNSQWQNNVSDYFSHIFLSCKPLGADKSIGFDAIRIIKRTKFDFLIISGYSSPSIMLAILYCKIYRIPYFIESDGGFNKKDRFPINIIKKLLLCKASGHFTPSDEHIKYLEALGIPKNNIYKYPFTSLKKDDINSSIYSKDEKQSLKNELGITENKIIISVGRFSYMNGYGKGYDVVLKAANELNSEYGFYIIGDDPTQEFIDMKNHMNLDNVHFVGFKNREELKKYYAAADLFVLMTVYDVWGLVINEAMAHGLPVITTDMCAAGLELVRNGENGYIIPVRNAEQLAENINSIIKNDEKQSQMGKKSLEIINDYTIEKMAQKHIEVFNKI